MRKLIFINRYFYPDESATSQLLSDLAFDLAGAGYDVHVVASRQRYEQPMARLPSRERVHGVTIARVWTSRWGRDSLLGRAVDYLTFYLTAGLWLLGHAGRGDVIVAKTDPPLIGVVAAVVARIRRADLINWLQDLYPEVAAQLKVGGMGAAEGFLKRLRNWSLKSARMNVVIGRCMGELLQDCGIPPTRTTVIANWVDDGVIQPLPRRGNPLRAEWELDDSFVVGYSGNMGRVHDFDRLLEAATRLVQNKRIRFLFVGAGAKKNELRDLVEDRGLSNVMFKPFQAQTRLGQSLTVPDIHIVSLHPFLEGLIVPSKFYGAIAAGRGVIFLGPAGSEVARVIREWECGFVIDQADPGALSALIESLAADPDRVALLGEHARQAAAASFTRKHALSAWREVLDPVGSPRIAVAEPAPAASQTNVSS